MTNQIKILMIGPDIDAQGGIASVIKSYFENGLSNNAIFLASSIEGNTVHKILFFPDFLIKYMWILIKNKNIKLIHIQSSSKGSFLRKSIALYIAKFFNKKVVFHYHSGGFEKFYNNSPLFLKNRIINTLNKSDVLLVLADYWKNIIKEKCQNNNIRVLYNPTAIKEINYNERNKVNVLFLGRLGKNKGVYDIIEAAKLLNNNAIELYLYGDGDMEEFKSLVKEANLHGKVIVSGWIAGEDKDKALQDADIYILPSYSECLPMSILEAMAVGLPIISTHVGGIPEEVEDGVNGFLIEPGDYKALAEKINLLAGNKKLREQMGKESYRIAKEKFDINIITNQLKELYQEILEEKNKYQNRNLNDKIE